VDIVIIAGVVALAALLTVMAVRVVPQGGRTAGGSVPPPDEAGDPRRTQEAGA
jgi:hypothetical protein